MDAPEDDNSTNRSPSTRQRRGLSRRALLISGGVVAASGATAWAVTRAPQITMAAGTFGTVGPRVLVGYDSQYGSTGDVAMAIGQELGARARVSVQHLSQVNALDDYDAVVVGAPVQQNRWKASATQWLGDHSAGISHVPWAMFLTSMSFGISPDRAGQTVAKQQLLAAAARVVPSPPRASAPFGGFLDYGRMAPANAAFYMLMAADDTAGDFRDFAEVGRWAREIGPLLLKP
jgi:menaquinone-dependent protoporphyrinogen IX oxidase